MHMRGEETRQRKGEEKKGRRRRNKRGEGKKHFKSCLFLHLSQSDSMTDEANSIMYFEMLMSHHPFLAHNRGYLQGEKAGETSEMKILNVDRFGLK